MSTTIKKKSPTKKTQSRPNLLTEHAKRDARLIKIILADPDRPLNECMIEAGFSKSTANKQSRRCVEKSSFQTAMTQAMLKSGITDDLLADKIRKGIDCTKVISAVGSEANGVTFDIPDHPTQHKYIDTALKLKKAYPDPKVDVAVTGDITLNVVDYSKKVKK